VKVALLLRSAYSTAFEPSRLQGIYPNERMVLSSNTFLSRHRPAYW